MVNGGFFGLDLPGIWRKVLGERDVLWRDVNVETIFNFFVTAYHVMDYVKAMRTVPEARIREM